MKRTFYPRVICLSFIIYHLSFSTAGAQTFTQRLQQGSATGGRITLHQDAAISELVDGKTTTAPASKPSTAKPAKGNATADRTRTDTPRTQTTTTTQEQRTDTTADTTADEGGPRRMRKVQGYRIQVFVGGKTQADRQKAEQTGNTLRSLFPSHRVYVHFYSPRWICRMGDFRTVDEAKEVLDEVVRLGYDTSTIVRGKVSVPY